MEFDITLILIILLILTLLLTNIFTNVAGSTSKPKWKYDWNIESVKSIRLDWYANENNITIDMK